MRHAERIVRGAHARGELWTPAPGLLGLRGPALRTLRAIENAITALCQAEQPDEWLVPPALPLAALERSGYFASFPQWLTLASHLTSDATTLERIAASDHPARDAAAAGAPASAALPPAVCYHVYAALADSVVRSPRLVTAQGYCWRHEGDELAPLRRGWAFTMRELVCIGTEADCLAFRDRGLTAARALASRLNLAFTVVAAEDPFFAPTARGRALVQRLKELKLELRLDIGDGDTVAAASFNLHERFFGEAFDIRLRDGSPAFTACVAFGLERWLLASMTAACSDAASARART
jgi:seryl-tRNA synthetase